MYMPRAPRRPHPELPEAYAIVNPYQDDCSYRFKKFAGVGVSFKLMALLYERLHKPLPAKVYELLLLGTVADVVPLLGDRRECADSESHNYRQQNRNPAPEQSRKRIAPESRNRIIAGEISQIESL